MAKRVMQQDAELFDGLVLAVKSKIIIGLGRITYEMVAKVNANRFLKKLREGIPFRAAFPMNPTIPVYGVSHCGSSGFSNVDGVDNNAKSMGKECSGVSKLVPRKEFGCLAGIETASRIPELKRDWIDELDAMDDEDD